MANKKIVNISEQTWNIISKDLLSSKKHFEKFVKIYFTTIEDYPINNLEFIFPSVLSSDERHQLHRYSQYLYFMTQSYSVNEERKLHVTITAKYLNEIFNSDYTYLKTCYTQRQLTESIAEKAKESPAEETKKPQNLAAPDNITTLLADALQNNLPLHQAAQLVRERLTQQLPIQEIQSVQEIQSDEEEMPHWVAQSGSMLPKENANGKTPEDIEREARIARIYASCGGRRTEAKPPVLKQITEIKIPTAPSVPSPTPSTSPSLTQKEVDAALEGTMWEDLLFRAYASRNSKLENAKEKPVEEKKYQMDDVINVLNKKHVQLFKPYTLNETIHALSIDIEKYKLLIENYTKDLEVLKSFQEAQGARISIDLICKKNV
jgi:hypothetical protein